jgi:hypothetical protein
MVYIEGRFAVRMMDAMLAAERFRSLDEQTGEPYWVAKPASFALPRIHVVADEVSRYFWQLEKDKIVWDRDFGPLRLPYPAMWIEWRVPSRAYAEGTWSDIPASHRGSEGLVLWHEEGQPLSIRGAPYTLGANGVVVAYPLEVEVVIDNKGAFGQAEVVLPAAWPREWQEKMREAALDLLRPALMTVGFMNCKNVSVVDERPPVALSGRHKRKTGRALERYSRVVLPSPQPRRSGESGDANGSSSLHLVRGHFKTYTEEAPLLGKHVGTWWWSWQVRGDEAAGSVIPEYEVSPIALQ